MSPQPKVSVIIPVYKAEKYIERCARSLFKQTLVEIEYIFVDDCSPDNSIKVLQTVLSEYPDRKNLVKIFRHEKNKGVGQTRQDGINAASGEYVIHCDPDDWVDISIYETLYNAAQTSSADMVICDFYSTLPDLQVSIQKPDRLDGLSITQQITDVSSRHLHGSLWNKLIRREILTGALMPVNCSYCEDSDYLTQILYKMKNIVYVAKPLYYYEYRRNSDSLCSVRSLETLADDEAHINDLIQRSLSNPPIRKCLQSLAMSIIAHRVLFCDLVGNAYFRTHFRKYRKYLSSYNGMYNRYMMIAMTVNLSTARKLKKMRVAVRTHIKKIIGF